MRYIILPVFTIILYLTNSVLAGAAQAGLQGIHPLEFPEPIGGVNGQQAPRLHLSPGVLPTPGHMGTRLSLGHTDVSLSNHGDEFTWIQINTQTTPTNIYFPVNGQQPTTPEAAIWSCANVGSNDLKHPVTEWYMEMFGWSGFRRGARLKMGFIVSPTPREAEIFNLDETMQKQATKGLSSLTFMPIDRSELFWDAFRVIAANPVGRILLYRLLIEIRRIDVNNRGARGLCEHGFPTDPVKRDKCRRVNISFGSPSFHRTEEGATIQLDDSYPGSRISVLAESHNRFETDDVAVSCPTSVVLFHEMLHWFHYLRDPDRNSSEKSPRLSRHGVETQESYILRAYYGDATDIGTIPEWSKDDRTKCEEIRTILGTPRIEKSHANNNLPQMRIMYSEGDDLSENLFRASMGLFMRWGHGKSIFKIELLSRNTILNAIRLAYQEAKYYCDQVIKNPFCWSTREAIYMK